MGCGECRGDAIRGLVATSPLHPAAPASGVAVVKTAALVAVRAVVADVAHHRC
jgi:hypothetical protein